MGEKSKKTRKAAGRPTDDGELQAQPRREWTNADEPEEPGVAINNLRDAGAETG